MSGRVIKEGYLVKAPPLNAPFAVSLEGTCENEASCSEDVRVVGTLKLMIQVVFALLVIKV